MSIDEARSLLLAAGLTIKDEADLANGTGHCLRLTNGALVNVFNAGNFNVQGKNQAIVRSVLESSTGGAADSGTKRVFVVHGQDTAAREQLELVLHKLGLDPFVLSNTAGGGLTIVEPSRRRSAMARALALALSS
jgi:predicted nucleotide-binding protein